MGRIYVPSTEPDDAEAAEVAEPVASASGRIYLPSSEPAAVETTAPGDEDDAGPADDQNKDDGSGKSSEKVTVTEPAEVEPGPPPPKKSTSQRGKTAQ